MLNLLIIIVFIYILILLTPWIISVLWYLFKFILALTKSLSCRFSKLFSFINILSFLLYVFIVISILAVLSKVINYL